MPRLILLLSVVMALTAYGLIAKWYVMPAFARCRERERSCLFFSSTVSDSSVWLS